LIASGRSHQAPIMRERFASDSLSETEGPSPIPARVAHALLLDNVGGKLSLTSKKISVPTRRPTDWRCPADSSGQTETMA
jgi:hypothetical protein